MQLFIKNWQCKNLRIPDMDIQLGSGINFFQVPNGGGKTTLIQLIQASLTNNWHEFMIDDGSYGTHFEELRDEDSKPSKGFFNLSIAWVDSKQKETKITFENNFNFDSGSKTTYTITANKGKVSSFKPPRALIPYLTDGHAKVFLFSGDETKRYFNQGTVAPVRDAIDSFAGIDGLKTSLKSLNDAFKARTALANRVAETTWDRKLVSLKKSKASLEKHKAFLTQEREARLNPWQELDDRVNSLDASQAKILEDREEIQKSLNHATNEIRLIEFRLSQQLRNPYIFSDKLADITDLFHKKLQDAKLPGHAAEFFIDIAKRDHCICGEPITESRKDHILRRKEDYLGNEHADTVNRMRTECRANIETCKELPIAKELELLAQQEEERQEWYQKLSMLENDHKNAVLSTDEIKTYDTLGDKIKEFDALLKKIEEPDQNKAALKKLTIAEIRDINSLPDCETLKKYLEQQAAQASGFRDELNRKDAFISIVQKGIESARTKICQALTDDINEKIAGSVEKTFRVTSIDSKINVVNKTKGGSMGQNIITVTAFTSAILERSGITYPLIIDHPIMPVELESRSAVSKMMVSSNAQVINLVINAEKDGFIFKQGSKNIHPHLQNAKFITMARTDRGIELGDVPDGDDTTETSNGIVSYNLDYFKDFIIEGKEH